MGFIVRRQRDTAQRQHTLYLDSCLESKLFIIAEPWKRLKSPYLAESSHFVDMGAGVGKVMWHAGVAACTVTPPEGVENNPELVKIAERIAKNVIEKASEDAVWKGWSSKFQVRVGKQAEDWISFFPALLASLGTRCPLCFLSF